MHLHAELRRGEAITPPVGDPSPPPTVIINLNSARSLLLSLSLRLSRCIATEPNLPKDKSGKSDLLWGERNAPRTKGGGALDKSGVRKFRKLENSGRIISFGRGIDGGFAAQVLGVDKVKGWKFREGKVPSSNLRPFNRVLSS